jgi:D-alanyl-lipoteichoic acid acyltransferase DltB (MBOAT superfamily)
MLSTVATWLTGFLVDKQHHNVYRKISLAINIIVNLGILFVFKYFNFFADTLAQIANSLGLSIAAGHTSLLLPVGISFYTFQALGYSIDVYRREIKHERNFINYALFVSFFPQLVAGPIERSKNLLAQIVDGVHKFSVPNTIQGLKIILCGMFKKIVVADMCALFVDGVFNNMTQQAGQTYLLALLLFSVQIYCDFSGYSDVARGSALLFGYQLMENFKSPYASTSISEFWSRWHISLSTWFKDYLYIPLGGNRKGFVHKLINTFVVFLVSGLWHGANITFVCWGFLHGFYRLMEELFRKFFKAVVDFRSSHVFRIIINTLICFSLVCFSWILFRADTIGQSFLFMSKMISNWNLKLFIDESATLISSIMPPYSTLRWLYVIIITFSVALVLVTDFFAKYTKFEFVQVFSIKNSILRWGVYYFFIITIMFCFIMTTNEFGQAGAFIYFQF